MIDVQTSRTPFTPLRDALHDLHHAEDRLHAEQDAAWQRYVEEVDHILAADLRADDAPAVDEDAHARFAGVRARLDDLRVQAKLGTMEGQDLLAQVRTAAAQLSSRHGY